MSYTINSSIRAKYYGSSNRGNPRFIVLHYTGNDGTTATARGNANYFHDCPRKASAHLIVDERETVYQCVPDSRAAWSVGDASNGHGTMYGTVTNANSISVEMVSHSVNGMFYIPDATIQRAAEVVRDLMRKYSIPASRVVRHYDVTTKACPQPMCGTAARNQKWAAFKELLADTSTKNEPKEELEVVEKTNFSISGTPMQLNAINKDGTTYVNLRDYNALLGLKTDYDSTSGTRIISTEGVALDIDGTKQTLSGMNMNGTTYAGIRALADALGYAVSWDSETKTVVLRKA